MVHLRGREAPACVADVGSIRGQDMPAILQKEREAPAHIPSTS